VKLVEQANHNLKPCAYAAENRQFDFWVGEWNVETTSGAVPAGQSRIEKTLAGLRSSLKTGQSNGNPYSGKSYNIYNTQPSNVGSSFGSTNVGGNIFLLRAG